VTTSLLAYIPSPAQGVWHLGPVPIRAYALCIITGIIAALIIGDRRWVARGGEQGVIYDIALWTVPFGLVGGRLYHLMTDWRTYFAEGGAGIAGAVRIWDGGLGIWGAVALGGVGAWIGCRRHGIPLPAFGDAVAPGVILAQAIGRLGNYFNQELYGRPTDLPWGLQIFQRSDGSGVVNPHLLNGVSTGQVYDVVHPTFLYELLWNLLVFFLLLWADRRFKLGHGRLFALYVAAYCVGRFGVELMRSDTATLIAGIRVNSFTSTFVFIGAVVYMMVAPRGREDPATLGGRHADEVEAEAEVDVEAEGAVLAVPVAVAAGAAVGGGDDAEEVADEADAVETQPDETVALAEQAVDLDESADEAESDEDAAEAEAADTEEPGDEAEDAVDEDAVDAEAAVEESVDESVEKPVDSDEVEDEDESDTEAEELAVDEDEPAEEADEDVADETGVVHPEAEATESDDSDAAESEDAAVEEDVVAEDAAAEAEDEAADVADEDVEDSADEPAADEPAADEPAADEAAAETTESEESADEAEEVADETDEEADSDDEPADESVEEVEPKVAATEKVEPVGVPVWEPPAPRRRWWRRQG
jgi:prolipoprotein diacylglyceryl transferase